MLNQSGICIIYILTNSKHYNHGIYYKDFEKFLYITVQCKLCVILLFYFHKYKLTQSVGAAGYTDCTSAGGKKENESLGYDTKQSYGEVPVMLELWGMQITPSLPLLPGPFWPGW